MRNGVADAQGEYVCGYELPVGVVAGCIGPREEPAGRAHRDMSELALDTQTENMSWKIHNTTFEEKAVMARNM